MAFTDFTAVEPLEQRIAPASLVLTSSTNPNETITIVTSHGSHADLVSAVTSASLVGTTFVGDSLTFSIDLTGHTAFHGTDLTVSSSGGATYLLTNLDATGENLGKVTAHGGDFGRVEAGANSASVPALKLLEVDTLGGPDSLHSTIRGSVTTLKVDGSITGTLELAGRYGSLQTGTVGGNLEGSGVTESGSIITSGRIGSVTIGHSLEGGVGNHSGLIIAGGSISQVKLESIVGGEGVLSGSIASQHNIGSVTVHGDVTASASAASAGASAQVMAGGHLGKVEIGGSLIGGFFEKSGSLISSLGTSTVIIHGSLTGGAGSQSGVIGSGGLIGSVTIGTVAATPVDALTGGGGNQSGAILSSLSINRVTINGNIAGGDGQTSGAIASAGTLSQVTVHGSVTGGSHPESGSIGSKGALGTVTIDGNLAGGDGGFSGRVVSATSLRSVVIGGNLIGGSNSGSGAIGSTGRVQSVTVHGSVTGGSASQTGAILGGASMGSITVDGNVTAGLGSQSGVIYGIGKVDTVVLHGNLDGSFVNGSEGFIDDSAQIRSDTALGTVSIDGSVLGGVGFRSGTVYCTGPISSVTVGGDLNGLATGSGNTFGGSILTEQPLRQAVSDGQTQFGNPLGYNIGTVVVHGGLLGGIADSSGSVISGGSIGKVTVSQQTSPAAAVAAVGISKSGGLNGGNVGPRSGSVVAQLGISSVAVYDSVRGGSADDTGVIQSFNGRVGSVFIQGSMLGGAGSESASVLGASIGTVKILGDANGAGNNSGSIIASATDIGSVSIGGTFGAGGAVGSVGSGGSGSTSTNRISAERNIGSIAAFNIEGSSSVRVTISAGGNAAARTASEAVAIGSVRTYEHLTFTDILAGYDTGTVSPDGTTPPSSQPLHGHVSVGLVEAGIDKELSTPWEAVNVIAGATGGFGDAADISTGNKNLPSTIEKVLIHGAIAGKGRGFLLLADHIASIVAVNPVPLRPGPYNDAASFPSDADPGFTTSYYEVGTNLG